MNAWDKLTPDEIVEAIRREVDQEAAFPLFFGEFSRARVWDRVTERIFTGGEIFTGGDGSWGSVFGLDIKAQEETALDLVGAGVTHIIDCRRESNEAQMRELWAEVAPEVQYLYAGTGDDGRVKDASYFESPLAWSMEALSRPWTKIYAHCQCGINRGPSMAAAILMAQGLTMPAVQYMIQQARPCAGLDYLRDAHLAVHELGWT